MSPLRPAHATLRHRLRVGLTMAAPLALLLSGCAAVGPDFQAPTAKLDPFHNEDAVAARAAKTPAPPLDTWWEGFNDPVLTRLVTRALDQNLDLAASMQRVEQARAVAKGAGAKLMPKGGLDVSMEPIHQSVESPLGALGNAVAGPGFDPNQTVYDVGVSASWEVDLFGGLRRGAEAADAEFRVAEALHAGERVSVAAEVADAYLQVRGDQARIAVAEEQVRTDQHLLDLVKEQFSRGIVTDRQIAQAEALLSHARASFQPLRIDLEMQLNKLDVLMGAQPGTYAAELRAVADIPAVPAVGGGDQPVDMLRRRPDIIAAETRLMVTNARIGQAVAEYYPKLSLSGVVGFESLAAGDMFQGNTFQPLAVFGLRWRLFDFGRVDAEVEQAKGADAEALIRYRQSVLRAAQDVENAFVALVQWEAHADELRREVDALTRARDSSQEAYRGGLIALTDVLDADRQLLAAQDELARTRADAARAAVASFRALGGGWKA
ncbi:MAG: TolC family protein [Azospirillaceae bacterium]|nr:TolC family protein [Azospirillaceae bacterium]